MAENLIDHDDRLCETASLWQLLSGGFAPGFSHWSYNTPGGSRCLQISTAVRTSPVKDRSTALTMPHSNHQIYSTDGLLSKVSLVGFIFLCLNLLFFYF